MEDISKHSRAVRVVKILLICAAFALLGALLFLSIVSPVNKNYVISTTADNGESDKPMDQKMVNPVFHAEDAKGRPFVVGALSALKGADENILLNGPEAQIKLGDKRLAFVSSDSGDYHQASSILTLNGNVKLRTSEGYEFVTRSAVVDVNESKIRGNEPIKGRGVSGEISAKSFLVEDEGEEIKFLKDVELVIVRGEGVQPILIDSQNLTIIQSQNKAVFVDDVRARQDGMIMQSERMDVLFGEGSSGTEEKNIDSVAQSSIEKIIAVDDVFVTTREETAKGQRAVYDAKSEVLVLTGDVVLTRAKNVAKGEKLVYNVKTGKSDLVGPSIVEEDGAVKKGRVRAVVVPE